MTAMLCAPDGFNLSGAFCFAGFVSNAEARACVRVGGNMENLIKLVLWLAVIGFAIYGVCRWWERRQEDAWENRPRIGFQPNPEPSPAT